MHRQAQGQQARREAYLRAQQVRAVALNRDEQRVRQAQNNVVVVSVVVISALISLVLISLRHSGGL